MDLGPAAMRVARLRQRIAGLGYEVRDKGDLRMDCPVEPPPAGEKLRYLDEIKATCELLAAAVRRALEAGELPIVLGGDHSIALPELRAAAAVHGPLALVQFDSHPDTWDAYFGQKHTHGTPFRRAVEEGLLDPSSSIQVGMRGSIYDKGDWDDAREMGFDLVPTDEVRQLGIPDVIDRIRERVGDARTYVSFDVDFVDPAFAPGTGTPEIGGFTSREAQEFARGLAGIEIVGCDVVEVYPSYDGPGQITSLLAANVAYEFLTLIAASRGDYKS